MPERPTKEEIEAYEVRYLTEMADRYGGPAGEIGGEPPGPPEGEGEAGA